jgi:hypothetical protein
VRLAKRRLLEGFARFDDAARQGHLSAVAPEPVRAYRQDDVRAIIDGKEQQQPGRVAEVRRVEARRPLATRAGRQNLLGRGAGKGAGQGRLETVNDARKGQMQNGKCRMQTTPAFCILHSAFL